MTEKNQALPETEEWKTTIFPVFLTNDCIYKVHLKSGVNMRPNKR